MSSESPSSSSAPSPSKPTFKVQSIQVTFRVSPEMFQQIEDTSAETNMKSTDLMRLAISRYISSQPCPKCGSKNTTDARFCSTCGQPLTDEAWKGREIEEQKRAELLQRLLDDKKHEEMLREFEERMSVEMEAYVARLEAAAGKVNAAEKR